MRKKGNTVTGVGKLYLYQKENNFQKRDSLKKKIEQINFVRKTETEPEKEKERKERRGRWDCSNGISLPVSQQPADSSTSVAGISSGYLFVKGGTHICLKSAQYLIAISN